MLRSIHLRLFHWLRRLDARARARALYLGGVFAVLIAIEVVGRQSTSEWIDLGVVVLPGNAFGREYTDWVRISLVTKRDDVVEAARRLGDRYAAKERPPSGARA